MNKFNKFLLLVFFFILIISIVQSLKVVPLNPDTYWHLASGREIIKNKGLPQVDDFSYAGQNKWYSHEWLFDVLIYSVSKIIGVDNLYYFNLLLWLILLFTLMLILKIKTGFSNTPLFLPFLLIVVYLIIPYMSLRPQIFTFIFILYFIFVLENEPVAKNNKLYFSLPFVTIVWVNFHAITMIGIFLIFWYSLFYFIKKTIFAEKASGYDIRMLFFVMLGVIGATFLSPLGPRGFFMISTDEIIFLKKTVSEWQTAWANDNISDIVFFTLFYFYAVLFFLTLFYNLGIKEQEKKIKLIFDIVLNLIFFVSAIFFRRNMALFLIISYPSFVYYINAVYNLHKSPNNNLNQDKINKFFFGITTTLIFGVFIYFLVIYNSLERQFYPKKAIKYVNENKPPHNIFSDMLLSGFFEYYLFPEYKVMLSGRLNHSRKTMQDYVYIYNGADNFMEKVKEYNINTFFVGYDSNLINKLLKYNYGVVYFDDVTMIFVKKGKNTRCFKYIFPYNKDKLYNDNKREEALKELGEFIDKYPSEIAILIYSMILLDKEREKAIQFLESNINKYKNYYSLYNLLGTIYYQNNDYQKSLQILKLSKKKNNFINKMINDSKRKVNKM